MILIIDNYDSFTYNLVHLIGTSGADVIVKRNDSLTIEAAMAMGTDGIVLSPGPCTPAEAGICMGLARAAKLANTPLLGVCLGHQSIIAAAGGRVDRARRQMHGRTSPVCHVDDPLFEDVPSPFTATRYHSLSADADALPPDIYVLAHADDDEEIMSVRWGDAPIWGVQFHPESIASECGDVLIRNFLRAADTEKAANR